MPMNVQEVVEIKNMLGQGHRCFVEAVHRRTVKGFYGKTIYLEDGALGEVKDVYTSEHPEDHGHYALIEWAPRMATFNMLDELRLSRFIPRRDSNQLYLPFY